MQGRSIVHASDAVTERGGEGESKYTGQVLPFTVQ